MRGDDDAVEAHAEDPVERLLLGPVAEPQHHPGRPLGEDVADALQELREVAVAEQPVRVDVEHDADDARAARGERPARPRSAGSRSPRGPPSPGRRVVSATGPPLMTRETVARETPLRVARSSSVRAKLHLRDRRAGESASNDRPLGPRCQDGLIRASRRGTIRPFATDAS